MDASDPEWGQDGVICDRVVRITDITDGTSSTLMFGEFANFDPNWSAWPPLFGSDSVPISVITSGWSYPYFNPIGSSFNPINPTLPAAPPGDPSLAQLQLATRCISYGSRHTSGANFVMADGSVKFISNGVNGTPGLMSKLGTRARGEVVNGDF